MFVFAEDPCWIPKRQAWVFSDISPSENANGNFLDSEGRLLTCEHKTRALTRTDMTSGARETLANTFQDLPLNSPNDVIQSHRTNAIYFTDPDYGSISRIGHGQPAEQSKNHVFRLDPSSGELTSIAEDFVRPNGLALNSPTETKMYIADSGSSVANGSFDPSLPHHVRVFDLSEDGKKLSDNGEVFCVVEDDNGVPDGVRCDVQGNVWVCVKSGVDVYNPSGEMVARVQTSEKCANAAFGGPYGTQLMLCTCTSVWLLETKVRGAGDVRSINLGAPPGSGL